MSQPFSISVASSIEKSRLASDVPWLALAKLTWPDASVLRLVRNVDDVQFDCGDGAGVQTYTAFSWEFSELQENSDGSIPNWSVKVSNVNRAVEALLEQFGGGVSGSVTIYVINGKKLNREPELELDFDITGCSSDAQWVTFTLGAQSPFRIQFGRHPYSADSCVWRYKGPQCGYTGDLPTCSFRLGGANGCREHSNQVRFGAFPGVDSNGLRAVTR